MDYCSVVPRVGHGKNVIILHANRFENVAIFILLKSVLLQFLHINNGSVELDTSIMGLQQEGKKTKVPLNSR